MIAAHTASERSSPASSDRTGVTAFIPDGTEREHAEHDASPGNVSMGDRRPTKCPAQKRDACSQKDTVQEKVTGPERLDDSFEYQFVFVCSCCSHIHIRPGYSLQSVESAQPQDE